MLQTPYQYFYEVNRFYQSLKLTSCFLMRGHQSSAKSLSLQKGWFLQEVKTFRRRNGARRFMYCEDLTNSQHRVEPFAVIRVRISFNQRNSQGFFFNHNNGYFVTITIQCQNGFVILFLKRFLSLKYKLICNTWLIIWLNHRNSQVISERRRADNCKTIQNYR